MAPELAPALVSLGAGAAIAAVVLVVVVALIVIALVARSRSSRLSFQPQPLPASFASAYETRLADLEKMFVAQPREAVAGSKQLVDDMLTRMGYPVRLTPEERVKDLRKIDREHADSYGKSVGLGSNATTEELRRALQGHLELARSILHSAGTAAGESEAKQPAT